MYTNSLLFILRIEALKQGGSQVHERLEKFLGVLLLKFRPVPLERNFIPDYLVMQNAQGFFLTLQLLFKLVWLQLNLNDFSLGKTNKLSY